MEPIVSKKLLACSVCGAPVRYDVIETTPGKAVFGWVNEDGSLHQHDLDSVIDRTVTQQPQEYQKNEAPPDSVRMPKYMVWKDMRDEFAMVAMPSLLTQALQVWNEKPESDIEFLYTAIDEAADVAYKTADAMMRAREKK